MNKTTLIIACLLGCTLGVSAQNTEAAKPHDITIKFTKYPQGLANYYSGYYYFNGKDVYNMRNFLMYTGNAIKALGINPSGASYALLDNKKDKNTIDI